ncbi:APH(3'') family aminoglycoside O-phosphotransferase [Streptomyces aculeolatus]|uniref:APH(3'') family aminoglycoside O-phosphotransferase n=1 Tax=Streptomyces aculeolatus TaxID=270689 RepID=UPI001CECE7A6|nr:APH(3'') family aminoglycoside O-phosphotransferase [Streptomyces aculeolatus]
MNLPGPGPGDWTPVTTGESGAAVFRSADGSRYAKCVSATDATGTTGTVAELAAERDRVTWLAGQGVPGPRVLDFHADDTGARLVTTAVAGVPADRLPPEDLRASWGRIAEAVRALHALPAASCPYRWDLDAVMALARDVVARGAVHPEFLPEEQQGTPPEELLARLEPQLPRRRKEAADDTVVCHGDLTLPNIVLDPDTGSVAGFIDLGRLGLADRHTDLALLFTHARETWPDEAEARARDADFAAGYGTAPDPDRLRFYLHLDPLTWG